MLQRRESWYPGRLQQSYPGLLRRTHHRPGFPRLLQGRLSRSRKQRLLRRWNQGRKRVPWMSMRVHRMDRMVFLWCYAWRRLPGTNSRMESQVSNLNLLLTIILSVLDFFSIEINLCFFEFVYFRHSCFFTRDGQRGTLCPTIPKKIPLVERRDGTPDWYEGGPGQSCLQVKQINRELCNSRFFRIRHSAWATVWRTQECTKIWSFCWTKALPSR